MSMKNLAKCISLVSCIGFMIIGLVVLVWVLRLPVKEKQQVSYTISPIEEYVDYDPMENISDSLAMYLQELRCK